MERNSFSAIPNWSFLSPHKSQSPFHAGSNSLDCPPLSSGSIFCKGLILLANASKSSKIEKDASYLLKQRSIDKRTDQRYYPDFLCRQSLHGNAPTSKKSPKVGFDNQYVRKLRTQTIIQAPLPTTTPPVESLNWVNVSGPASDHCV